MIELIVKGLIIGVLVSAPMGPIGMLVIRRTLYKGRWHGFITGLGAALSDVIYAALIGLAMGFVVSFVESNQTILQLSGSAVLAGFGIYIYRSNPTKRLRKQKALKKISLAQDFISAFFLTFSNVLIVLLYIALFARFGFIRTEYSAWMILAGVISVGIGAILWWLITTYIIYKMRDWFNIRGLWLLNRITGSIIIAVSAIGFISAIVPSATASVLNISHSKSIKQMKKLKVLYLPTLDVLDLSSVPLVMEKKVQWEYIEVANWEEYSYKPVTAFGIARTDKNLYIRYFVRSNSLKALYDKDGSPVYTDSCVEFFMKKVEDDEYMNFEFNCIGTCDASRRLSRSSSSSITPEEYQSIRRYTSVKSKSFSEKTGIHAWELIVCIPFAVMGLDPVNLPEKIMGNFYKCADGTKYPHYLSWNPVGTEQPDFHRPEYFGEIYLK
jgi:threonine/homoserine/homoserine lactone efflux protein